MEGNQRIVVLPEVQPVGDLGRRLGDELLAIEGADEVLGSTATEGTARIDVDDHHPLLLTRRLVSELEEVGALKLVGACSVAFAEGTHVVPLLQILRAVEAHLFVS